MSNLRWSFVLLLQILLNNIYCFGYPLENLNEYYRPQIYSSVRHLNQNQNKLTFNEGPGGTEFTVDIENVKCLLPGLCTTDTVTCTGIVQLDEETQSYETHPGVLCHPKVKLDLKKDEEETKALEVNEDRSKIEVKDQQISDVKRAANENFMNMMNNQPRHKRSTINYNDDSSSSTSEENNNNHHNNDDDDDDNFKIIKSFSEEDDDNNNNKNEDDDDGEDGEYKKLEDGVYSDEEIDDDHDCNGQSSFSSEEDNNNKKLKKRGRRNKREAKNNNTSESSESVEDGKKNDTKNNIRNDVTSEESSEENANNTILSTSEQPKRRRRSLLYNQKMSISSDEKNYVKNLATYALDEIDVDNYKIIVLKVLNAKKNYDNGYVYHIITRVGISKCLKEEHKPIDLNKTYPEDKCADDLHKDSTKICKLHIHVNVDKQEPEVLKLECYPKQEILNKTHRNKRQSVGGLTRLSVNNRKVKSLANHVLLQIDRKCGCTIRTQVIKILSASSQVVNGTLYKLKIKVRHGRTIKICNYDIWDRHRSPNRYQVTERCSNSSYIKTYTF